MQLPMRIRLPGGTLKIKRFHHLRHEERDNAVPVWKIGRTYFVWHKDASSRKYR